MARPKLGSTQTPTTAGFGDVASAGTVGDNAALAQHRHGMPADPVTAHNVAGHPHSSITSITATDHHAAPVAGPDSPVTIDSLAPAGTAGAFARSLHGHRLDTDTGVAALAFGGSAAVGSIGTVQRANHQHAMPADPVIAHAAAADPHTGYRLESADHTHASTGLQGGTIPVDTLAAPTLNTSTPTFSGQGTATITAPVSAWIKIGRLVQYRLTFNVTVAGTGASVVTIANTGLPGSSFPVRTGGERNATTPLVARLSIVSTVMQVSAMQTAAAPTADLTGAGLATGNYAFHGSYISDS